MVDLLGMFRRRAAKRGRAGFARSRADITALGDGFGEMLASPVRDAPPIARDASVPGLDLPRPALAEGLPAVLVDAYRAGQPGGTGIALDWQKLQRERNLAAGVHLVLAGGLTAENVAEAISVARPDAVDVASGVESAPGRKDPAKVRAFVAAAREAFAQLPAGV